MSHIPSVAELVGSTPPGTNTYVHIRAYLDNAASFHAAPGQQTGLIIFIIVYVFALCVSTLIALVPVLGRIRRQKSGVSHQQSGKESLSGSKRQLRTRSLWLVRLQSSPEYSTSYMIWNGRLALAVAQVIQSILAIILLCLVFAGGQNTSIARNPVVYVLITSCWLPGWIGFHLYAWSALTTSLLSPAARSSGVTYYLRHPVTVNVVPSVILFLGSSSIFCWASAVATTTRNLFRLHAKLDTALLSASQLDPSAISTAFKLGPQYLDVVNYLVWELRGAAITWSILGGILIIDYAITMGLLIRLLRRCVRLAKGNVSLMLIKSQKLMEQQPSHTLSVPSSTTALNGASTSVVTTLERSYRALSYHCVLMLLLIGADVVIAIIVATRPAALVINPSVRLSYVFGMAAPRGILLTIGMIIPAYKVLTERNERSSGHQVSNPSFSGQSNVTVAWPSQGESSSGCSEQHLVDFQRIRHHSHIVPLYTFPRRPEVILKTTTTTTTTSTSTPVLIFKPLPSPPIRSDSVSSFVNPFDVTSVHQRPLTEPVTIGLNKFTLDDHDLRHVDEGKEIVISGDKE